MLLIELLMVVFAVFSIRVVLCTNSITETCNIKVQLFESLTVKINNSLKYLKRLIERISLMQYVYSVRATTMIHLAERNQNIFIKNLRLKIGNISQLVTS